MKKIYLCALALSVGSLSFGQKATKSTTPFGAYKSLELRDAKNINNNINDKVGATLWSNSFDTPTEVADWAIASTTNDWVIGTQVAAGTFPVPDIVSTSGGAHALFDSDLYCTTGDDVTLTIVTPINLLVNPAVILQFEQNYRKYQDVTFVGVSSDAGATWNEIEVNSDIALNGSSTNPALVSVNITAFAANQASVLIRFHLTGACDYAWYIDDVKIVEADNNEIVANNTYFGFDFLQYTRIPVSQSAAAGFSSFAKNDGSKIQPNTVLTVYDNGAVASTGTPADLAPGDNDSLTAPAYTPATAVGVPHVFTMTISSDSTSVESDILNNTVDFPAFEYTNSVYALDDYGTTPGNGGGENGTTGDFEFEAGNYFDAVADHVVGSIQVVVGTAAVADAFIDVVLYSVDAAGDFVEVSRSLPYQIVAADLGNPLTLDLATVPNPIIIAGTTYFAAVHSIATTFSYGTSGNSPDGSGTAAQASLVFYPSMTTAPSVSSFYTSNTPMVRMILEASTVGIENINNTTSFSTYPNPSSGVFNINLSSNDATNVNLTVKNVVGQTVLTETVSGNANHKISLTDHSKGIYFLTVGNETVKLIVE